MPRAALDCRQRMVPGLSTGSGLGATLGPTMPALVGDIGEEARWR